MKIFKSLLVLPLLLLAPSLLQAHTELVSALPANGAVVHQSPSALVLDFSEEVQLLKLNIVAGNGAAVATGFKADATAMKRFSVAMPALSPAAYKVSYTVLGKDGHRVEGELAFTVDPAATEAAGHVESHDQHGNH